ncbi:hypothetical protein [Okeania sp. SIO2C2]|nr:hypothetical protein [Okeania sp. SIO2C2]
MVRVGVNPPLAPPPPRSGSQEDRVRRNGSYRGCSRKNSLLIFLS